MSLRLLLYLDTNIFLDLIRNRNDDSRELFREIVKGEYGAITSTFTQLEIMEEEQERIFAEREIVHRKRSFDEVRNAIGQRDLTNVELESVRIILGKQILKPFIDKEKIELRYLTEVGWDRAFEFQSKLNISATDSIHLAIADIAGCDIFVTNDTQLRKVASSFFAPSVMVFAKPSDMRNQKELLRKARSRKKVDKERQNTHARSQSTDSLNRITS